MTDFTELTNESPWPPTTNGMPPLEEEDFPDTLLWQYIQAREPDSLEGELHALAVSLARLADKSVREYRAARDELTAFIDTPAGVNSLEGHTHLLRAIDHHENCVDAIRRAEGYFSTTAFEGLSTPEQRTMLKDLHEGVHRIRNSIQHAHERVAEGRIPDGEPLFPAMTSDGLYFAGDHIFHAELGTLVIEVWLLASAGIQAVTPD